MKLWYGRWCSSYKSGDEVLVLLNDNEYLISNIYFNGEDRGDFYIGWEGVPLYNKEEVYAVMPSDDWYIAHTEEILDHLTKPDKRKRRGLDE